jgi:hypothetical protein
MRDLGWPTLRPWRVLSAHREAAFLTLAVLAYLWLVSSQRLWAQGFATYDDYHFIDSARFLLEGQWLGPYDNVRLTKGPGYPLWVALNAALGLPLLLSQHVLYVSACLGFLAAAKPEMPSGALRSVTFSVLLFNPIGFDLSARCVAREGIYPALTLWVVACLVGIAARRHAPLVVMRRWLLGLGISYSALWFTREESPWVLPLVGLLLGYTAWAVWRQRSPDRWARLRLCALPVALWLLLNQGVRQLNYVYYQFPGYLEFTGPSFGAAIGALQRVAHASPQRLAALPLETRRRIYAVSPAFQEIGPILEGPLGRTWADASASGGRAIPPGEVGYGWLAWSIREAVFATGYRDSPGAESYYVRLAQEINAACEQGALVCGPRNDSMVTPWRSEHLPFLLAAVGRSFRELVSFSAIDLEEAVSSGSYEQLQLFERMTHTRLAPTEDERAMAPQSPTRAQRWKLTVMHRILALYQWTIPLAAGFALAAWLLSSARRVLRRDVSLLWVLNCGMLGALSVRVLLLAYIDATSFPAVNTYYLGPGYALVLLFVILSPVDLARVLPGRTAARLQGARPPR